MDHRLGERTYALRGLYDELQERLPANAILQHNPNQPIGDVFHGLYADRQTAVETPACGVVFGGDTRLCDAAMPQIAKIFNDAGELDWPAVNTACRDLSIAALVVKDTDHAWSEPQSWIWKEQPFVANRHARAFRCGN